MKTRNVTLALPEDLLRRAKELAVRRETSLSALLGQLLREVVDGESGYEEARRRFMARMDSPRDLGTYGRATWTRDELHER